MEPGTNRREAGVPGPSTNTPDKGADSRLSFVRNEMRIGTNVGMEINGPRTIADIVDEVRSAAAVGLDGAWWAERPNIDALTTAAAAGLAVPGLHLGTAVVTTYPRHPLALASQVLTVQAAIGNRLTLGIGPGHKQRVEHSFGVGYDRPAEHTREYLTALMPLLRGEPVEFHGSHLHVAGQVRTPGAESPSVLLAALGVFAAPPLQLVLFLVLGALTGILAGIRPARRAARLNMITAIASV